MKTLLIFSTIACLLGNWSCGRQKWVETRNIKTNVFLEISNQNEIIRLGDSLQLNLLLPDTILVEDLNNQSMYILLII